jgi:hypothetical protein
MNYYINCYSTVTVFSEKCYSALYLNESRPHDREQAFWIACYSALPATTEVSDLRTPGVSSTQEINRERERVISGPRGNF